MSIYRAGEASIFATIRKNINALRFGPILSVFFTMCNRRVVKLSLYFCV